MNEHIKEFEKVKEAISTCINDVDFDIQPSLGIFDVFFDICCGEWVNLSYDIVDEGKRLKLFRITVNCKDVDCDIIVDGDDRKRITEMLPDGIEEKWFEDYKSGKIEISV